MWGGPKKILSTPNTTLIHQILLELKVSLECVLSFFSYIKHALLGHHCIITYSTLRHAISPTKSGGIPKNCFLVLCTLLFPCALCLPHTHNIWPYMIHTTNGIHTKHRTRETAFQSTLTCFAARQLATAYTTKILICQLCKRQKISREISLVMSLHRCLVKSLCQQHLSLSLAEFSVSPGEPLH